MLTFSFPEGMGTYIGAQEAPLVARFIGNFGLGV